MEQQLHIELLLHAGWREPSGLHISTACCPVTLDSSVLHLCTNVCIALLLLCRFSE